MNLCTDSERKWALEPESKPEIEGYLLHHKVMSNPENPKLKDTCHKILNPLKLTNSSPVEKVFNFIKINESLD